MTKKHYILIDTETTQKGKVKDFAAIIVNSRCEILHEISCVIVEHQHDVLFHQSTQNQFFSRDNLKKREQFYIDSIDNGTIKLYSIVQVNKWLENAILTYPDITIVAYNIAFDLKHCALTNINTAQFAHNALCLWGLCCKYYAVRRGFVARAVRLRLFSPKSIMLTNAQVMHDYLFPNNPVVEDHTAYSDLIFELRIFKHCLRQRKSLKASVYSWKKFQLPTVLERSLNVAL